MAGKFFLCMWALVSSSLILQAQDAGKIAMPDIVVPYAPDQPALRAEQVFIRHDDFLKLYRQANPDALQGPQVSPLGSLTVGAWFRSGALTQVDGVKYTMSFEGRFVVWCDSSDQVSIPLPIGPIAIRSVLIDGKEGHVQPLVVGQDAGNLQNFNAQQIQQTRQAPQVAVEQPAYTVQVSGTGFHVVDLKFDIAAQIEGDLGRADLPLRSAPTGTLEWILPDENLDAKVHGRTNVYRREGRTVILPVAQLSSVRLQWLPKTQKAIGDIVFHSNAASTLSVQDYGLILKTTVAITVRQGEVSELDVTIPEGYSVQSVTGDDVAGWTTQNTDATRSIQFQLRRPVNDSTKVTMQLFAPPPEEKDLTSLSVPISMVKGASRDLGSVILRAGSQFQIRSSSLSAVSQINATDASEPDGVELPGRPQLAWRYTRPPASITVRITPTADELRNDVIHAVRLEPQRQLWSSRMTLNISGSPRSRIDIQVPKNFLALDVSATGLKDWYFADDSDTVPAAENQGNVAESKTLSIQFTDARSGAVQIALQGQVDRDADRTQLNLRPPLLLDSTVSVSHLAVWLDAASESAGFLNGVGNGNDWSVKPPASLMPLCAEIAPTAPSLAFLSNSNRPGLLSIKLRDAISTLIGETVTVTNVTETATEIMLVLNWTVNRAAADTFAVDLPSSLASIMAFDVPGQRRIQRDDIGEGRTRVTLQLQTPVTDRLFVIGTASLPLPADKVIRPDVPAIIIPQGAPSTLSGQQHFSVLVNQSNGLLQPTADQPEDKVQPEQISTRIPPQLLQQAVAVTRLHSATAAWNLVYPEQFQVSPAVVTLATHTTVISDDGSWRSRHLLQVTNESRQFLPVVLPEDCRLMYCLVKGRPSRVVIRSEGETQRHLIPIPQSGALASGFEVEFALAGRFADSAASIRKHWQSEQLQIPVPSFPEFRDDPDYGISVSRNRWTVYVPNSWRATLVTDPAATNVLKAEQTDLEDASLLSEVEQASALLKAAKGAKSSYFRQQLQEQVQLRLENLTRSSGNTADTEQQRGLVLGKLSELQSDIFQRQPEIELQQQAAQQPIQINEALLQNRFLYEAEAAQNYGNSLNVDRFWSANGLRSRNQPQSGVSSRTKDSGAQAIEDNFRFGVTIQDGAELDESKSEIDRLAPDSEPSEAASRKRKNRVVREPISARPEPMSEGRSGDNKSGEAVKKDGKESAPTDKAVPQRSQLLLRRGSGLPQGNSEVADQTLSDPAEFPATFSFGLQSNQIPRSAPERQIMIASDAENDANDGLANAVQAESTGLLSLTFEIPTDGQRIDFLRVGGNPSLSLNVRSSQAFGKAMGFGWLTVCVIGMLLLIGPGRRGESSSFFLRLFLILTVTGLVFWLVLPGDPGQIGLFTSLLSAVGISITVAGRRLKQTPR